MESRRSSRRSSGRAHEKLASKNIHIYIYIYQRHISYILHVLDQWMILCSFPMLGTGGCFALQHLVHRDFSVRTGCLDSLRRPVRYKPGFVCDGLCFVWKGTIPGHAVFTRGRAQRRRSCQVQKWFGPWLVAFGKGPSISVEGPVVIPLGSFAGPCSFGWQPEGWCFVMLGEALFHLDEEI